MSFPHSSAIKNPPAMGDTGSLPGSGRLPGKFHWHRSLVGYSPWGHKESYITEATEHACMQQVPMSMPMLLLYRLGTYYIKLSLSLFKYTVIHGARWAWPSSPITLESWPGSTVGVCSYWSVWLIDALSTPTWLSCRACTTILKIASSSVTYKHS